MRGKGRNEGAIQGVGAWQGLVQNHEPRASCVVTVVTFVERGLVDNSQEL